MKSVLAIAIAWVGYSLTWFGWESIRGSNLGLLDLVVPGHLKSQSGVSQSGVSSGTLQPATPQQLGGPLGAGLFLPNPSTTLQPGTPPQQPGGPLGAGLFLPNSEDPLGAGLFLPRQP